MAQLRLSACLLKREEEMKGGKEGREGEQGLWSLTDIPVSSPKLFSFRSHFRFAIGFLRLLLPAPGASVAFTVIGSLSPSPTPQQHRHHLHRLPQPVSHPRPAD